LAYDVPLAQQTATFVQHLAGKFRAGEQYDPNVIEKELANYGITANDLFLKVPVPGKEGVFGLKVNVPVWYNIFLPLVKSYLMAREAALFNERNQNPLLPFTPLKDTERDRILCDIWTDLIQSQTTWFGYADVLKQGIHMMLKYGIMLCFPQEEWYSETQEKEPELGMTRGQTYTVKEGLRYYFPHPSRTYYDLMYPLTSLNTGTGCQFVGHWRVMRYEEVLQNKLYWNRKKISFGTNWYQSEWAANYFEEIYPCQMNYPFPAAAAGTRNQREGAAAWYNFSDHRDKAVFVAEHFQLVNPKEWGLANYNHPVWHRFTMAADNTPIFVEPCAYIPTGFCGYDYDQNAARTSSMANEIVPFQDMLGSLLSQIILSAKRNLEEVIFYDTNSIDGDDIRKIENLGEDRYRKTHYIPFDSLKVARGVGGDPRQAFVPTNLTKQQLQELFQLMPLILQLLERVAQISSQEVGSQATHQQSKAEVIQTGGASGNRVQMIGFSVDTWIDSWKRQLVDANLAYRDPEWEAQVSSAIPDLEEHLQTMGFEMVHKGKDRVIVKGRMEAVSLDQFASSAQGITMAQDKERSQAIFSLVATLAGQPDLHKKVGVANLLHLLEFAARLGGAGRSFVLPAIPDDKPDEEVPEAIMNAIKAAQQATLQAVATKLAQPLAQREAQSEQQIQKILEELKQLVPAGKAAQALLDKNRLEQEKVVQSTKIAQFKATKGEQRRDDIARRAERRKDAQTKAEIARKNLEASASVKAKAVTTASDIALEHHGAKVSAEIAKEKSTSSENP
jgi:hypothetical protein